MFTHCCTKSYKTRRHVSSHKQNYEIRLVITVLNQVKITHTETFISIYWYKDIHQEYPQYSQVVACLVASPDLLEEPTACCWLLLFARQSSEGKSSVVPDNYLNKIVQHYNGLNVFVTSITSSFCKICTYYSTFISGNLASPENYENHINVYFRLLWNHRYLRHKSHKT